MKTQGKVIPNYLSNHIDLIENLFFLGRLKAFWRRFIWNAQIKPNERVIDIGCGSGNLTLMVAEELNEYGEVIGLDASKYLIAACKRRNTKNNVQFIEGIMENIPFPGQSFDVVLSSLAIHHVPKNAKQKAFLEFNRILRKGGRFAHFGSWPTWLLAFKGVTVSNEMEYIGIPGGELQRGDPRNDKKCLWKCGRKRPIFWLD